MGGQFSYCVYPDAKIKKRKTKIEKRKVSLDNCSGFSVMLYAVVAGLFKCEL